MYYERIGDDIYRAPMDGTASVAAEFLFDLNDTGYAFGLEGFALDASNAVKQSAEAVLYCATFTDDVLIRISVNPFIPTTVNYTRGLIAKSPVNIANHRTYNPLGNYSSSYEIIQTTGRTSNNRSFVEAEGVGFIGDASLPYSGSLVTQFVTGARDFMTGTALPTFTRGESVFVNRFNAPGGTDVSSRGVLDTYAEEFAPNNDLNLRNNAVRSMLRSDLTRHTPKATDIDCSVTPTAYHSNNRNTRYYKQTPPQDSIQDLVPVPQPGTVTLDISAGKMYWTDPVANKVQRANMDGSDVEDLYTSVGTVAGLALDICAGKMYWPNQSGKTIQRANMDGTSPSPETLITFAVSVFGGQSIALDIAAGKMYWTNIGNPGQRIQRAPMDGADFADVENLITTLTTPKGITLDIAAGKMYWADAGTDKIQRANFNGDGIEDLVTGLDSPAGVALDLSLGKIYWADENDNRIQRANLDGSSVEVLVTGLTDPFSIALDISAGKMYWTDYGADKIQRANMPEKPVYDNGFITHAIPQCSLQYAWIKASALTDRTELLGYQNSGSY
jgi:hypothetical protein